MDNRDLRLPLTADADGDSQPSPATRTTQPAGIANALARRLHALFPSTQCSPPSTVPNDSVTHVQRRDPSPREFLKVRIVTWNMHDSLPKGDLTELLGEVPVYKAERLGDPPLASIPPLPADGKHPYHLVIIAGQECPTSSGLPMGLGAGFKLKDKERELISPVDSEPDLASRPYGWTAILEGWLSHAGGSNPDFFGENKLGGINGEPQTLVPPDLKRRTSTKSAVTRKGLYEILTKERMMGLYLAVYVHRDIKHLVRGLSKSSVTTGLIGGRVGNKGGTGISVNLDGTTLLFVNAHLAAHEGKVQHRLNDLAKIKGGLIVDDFLTNGDPRIMKEDLTDRFDYTFLFGDLNFRLDISRLHADWLISRKDYTQALGFDQLRKLMKDGDAFVGFNEADIDFPPTFKYDVMRTLKRHKPRTARSAKRDGVLTVNALAEESEVRVRDVGVDMENGDASGDDDDTGSLSSSNAASSTHQQLPEQGPSEDDYFSRAEALRASTGNLIQKAKMLATTQKTKAKWLTSGSPTSPPLLSSNKSLSSPMLSPGKPKRSDRLKKTSREGLDDQKALLPPKVVSTAPPTFDTSSTKSSTISRSVDRLHLGSPLPMTNRSKTISDEEIDGDRGVYDSSSKRRVPSWCDRILWKSTVEPDPDSDEGESEAPTYPKTRTRVSRFFANFMRYRKSSHASSASSEVSGYGHTPSVPSRDGHSTSPKLAPIPSTHIAVDGKESAQLPRVISPGAPDIEVSRQGHTESTGISDSKRTPGVGLIRSFSVDQALSSNERDTVKNRGPSRNWTIPARPSPLSMVPLTTEVSPMSTTPEDGQASKNVSPRWRFIPFLRGELGQTSVPADSVPTYGESMEATFSPTTSKPRKGDVVCLEYDSLDDKSMRRLEGRSDHRPVVSSFAIYL